VKVYCAKIVSPSTGEDLHESSWIQVGKEYVVISVMAVPERSPQLLIITDNGTPGWWDSSQFVTMSSRIPSKWVAVVSEGGVIEIAPKPWLEPGFWEAYFDRDQRAVETFDQELHGILAESD
jgi:hypothetical protein